MFGMFQMASGMSATDAVSKAQNGEINILDVRGDNEVATSGKAKGAIHIPLQQLPGKLAELAKDKPLAVYCASGGRSAQAAQFLNGNGFDAHNIGGLGNWYQAGGEIG